MTDQTKWGEEDLSEWKKNRPQVRRRAAKFQLMCLEEGIRDGLISLGPVQKEQIEILKGILGEGEKREPEDTSRR